MRDTNLPLSGSGRAMRRAIGYLESLLASGQVHAGDRLPPIAHLAQNAKVSLVSMWKAVGHLTAYGVLRSSQRAGTRVVSTRIPKGLPNAPSRKNPALWQRLAHRIEEEVVAGFLGTGGRMPSMKELQARYNADYRTVKKALGRAAAHRVIPDSGRSRRRPETTPALHNVPVFIYDHHDELSLQYLDAEVLRTIEHACRSNGLNPTFVRYRREGPSFRYINHATAMPWRPDGGELGAFWIALADNEILDDCCGRLLALNAPIAVFDSTDEQTFPAFFRNSARTAFFEAMPAGRAGEILGSLLLKLEHRRVAYVSTHFGTLWSRGNAEGLRRAFSAAGTGHSVSFVTRDLPPDDSPSATVAASLGAKATRLGRLHSRFGKKLLHSLFQRTVESATGQAFRSWLFAEGMEKLFRRALKDRGVSAWVCANDSEAIQALDFLKRHGIAVPRALSVAGISNTIDAVRFNLTSCGDDYNTIFRAMADYVVRPGVPSRDAKVRPITGFIVERGSTGPAPGYPGNRDYLAR